MTEETNMELEIIKKVLVEVLSVDASEIHMETTFLGDLGADSLDIYQIVVRIEEELSIRLEEKDITKIETVGQAVELVQKAERKQKP